MSIGDEVVEVMLPEKSGSLTSDTSNESSEKKTSSKAACYHLSNPFNGKLVCTFYTEFILK